jgi:DNA-binding CsgD family transcriptional regulator
MKSLYLWSHRPRRSLRLVSTDQGASFTRQGRATLKVKHREAPHPPLLGREQELAAIAAAVENPGEAPILELVGEPGIGKTALLDELRGAGERHDYLVFSGRATELESDVPFAPFIEALDDYLGTRAGPRLRRLGDDQLAELARVFPAMRGEAEPGPALESERYRAHRAVRALLEELSRESPLLLTIDDAHWADPASLELLGYLLRYPPAGPVAIAIAYRTGQAPEQLRRAIDNAAREGLLTRLELKPLLRDEANALIGDQQPPPVREELYRESGGNPLFLSELLRFGANHGSAATGRVELEVPERVTAVLTEEIEALHPEARSLAQGAAIAGEPFEAALAASASELSESAALRRLDELAAVGLVSETETPARFRFRHPLVRRAVYETAPPGWRIAAHRRVASALERSGAPPVARAHHLERSAHPGDAEAIATLIASAQAAAPRAPATAAHWLSAALRLLPADDERRPEMLIARASALAESGALADGRDALLEALSLLPPEPSLERVRLIAFLAAVETLLGRHPEAGRRLRAELASVTDQRSPEAGALHAELATSEAYAGRYEAIIDEAQSARAIASENQDAVAEAEACALLVLGELGRGLPDAASQALDRATTLLDAAPDEALAGRIGAAFYVGQAAQWGERTLDSRRHFERAVEVSRATGQGQLLAPMLTGQAWAEFFLGRLDRADELGRAAIDSARLGANPLFLALALFMPTLLGIARGNLDEALTAAEEAAELARQLSMGNFSAAQAWIHGWALLEAGHADRCVEVIEAAGLTDPDRVLVVPGAMCVTCDVLARAEVERGRDQEAQRWGEQGIAFTQRVPAGAFAAFGLGAQAVALIAAGQGHKAADLALRAAAGAEGVGARLIAARSRTLGGQALAAAGESQAAIEELGRAHSVLRESGAERWADEAARELRKLGGRASRPTRSVAASGRLNSLSPREGEVAELVAEGRSNREVAAALYLSEKTVEGNLRRIFAKLGISRRGQIAALLHRE